MQLTLTSDIAARDSALQRAHYSCRIICAEIMKEGNTVNSAFKARERTHRQSHFDFLALDRSSSGHAYSVLCCWQPSGSTGSERTRSGIVCHSVFSQISWLSYNAQACFCFALVRMPRSAADAPMQSSGKELCKERSDGELLSHNKRRLSAVAE